MKQNLVSLAFSEEDLAALDAALDVVEEKLSGLVALTSDEVPRRTEQIKRAGHPSLGCPASDL